MDPYHAYYRQRLDKFTRGEALNEDATPTPSGTGVATPAPGGAQDQMDFVDIGLEPPAPDFIMDIQNISAIDLYVPLIPPPPHEQD